MVRARIENIEKNLKNGSGAVPVPAPSRSGSNARAMKPIKTNNLSVDTASPPVSPTDAKLKSSNQSEDDAKPRAQSAASISGSRSPQFPAMKSSYLEREEHVLRPSLARTIKSATKEPTGPTYKEVTEKHMKSQNKLTVNLVGSAVLNKKRENASS
jgi:hypothetical protein